MRISSGIRNPGTWDRPGRRRAAALLAAVLAAAGCRSDDTSPIARWRMAWDNGLSRPPTADEAGQSGSLLGRWLSVRPPKSSDRTDGGSTLVLGSDGWSPMKAPKDPEADAELQAAQDLFQQNKLVEAEAAFTRIAKKHKGKHWGEKAEFYLAESLYQRGKLVKAHDAYEKLIADYPGTQFLDKAVAREYAIAGTWLAAIDPKAKPEDQASMQARWDGKFPMVDTGGFALSALEHVRHHDPTGPLADDAVLKIADYHYANQNWDDAALYYDQLVTDHPKSPFVQQAILSSIDSKMKGYIGPEYDGSGLEQAKNQVVQTMANFPTERQVSHERDDALKNVLNVIDEQMAERSYRIGEHYLWTGKVAAAEYCFAKIPAKWPKSPYAKQAKEQLAKIATMPRKETRASRIMTRPGSSDPMTGGSGAGGGMMTAPGMMGPNGGGGMGMMGP
jgi:outer membrane protein assembly factor BamD (BamD/ComL family)